MKAGFWQHNSTVVECRGAECGYVLAAVACDVRVARTPAREVASYGSSSSGGELGGVYRGMYRRISGLTVRHMGFLGDSSSQF